MIEDLLNRHIEKRPTTLKFEGRILYLLDDAELMRGQLYEGIDSTPARLYKPATRPNLYRRDHTSVYLFLL